MEKENNVINFPPLKPVEPVKPVQPVPPVKPAQPRNENREHYRIGCTPAGMTTLTIMSHDGMSITLSMNEEACEQMIRMLRATYE